MNISGGAAAPANRIGFLRRTSAGLIAASCLMAMPLQARAQAPGTIYEVKPGDSFARIAANLTGNILLWRKAYSRQKSGLPNPGLIVPGQRLEVVRDADGSTYLRLITAPARPTATQAASPVAATPSAAKPAASPAQPPRLPETLTIGMLPNIPLPALLAQNEPLKAYLERTNRNKVNLVSAANFRAFFESTMKGEYDLAIIAANLARVAQLDGGLVPIAMYEPRIRALLVGAKDQGIRSAAELRGRAVVFQNPQSLVALYARQWLQKLDLQQDRDFQLKAVRTDVGVGRMILTGEAAGAVMSNGEFRQIPPAEAERLVIVEQIAEIPNFVVLAHPRLGPAVISALRSQFQGFIADPVDGAAFTKSAGVARIVEADDRQMSELDAFLEPTRRGMGLIK